MSDNGADIAYTVVEDDVDGYTASVTGNADEGFVITNTRKPDTVVVEGAKTWNDSDDAVGKRPKSITIQLLANGDVLFEKVVSAADGWKWRFADLPTRLGGAEVTFCTNGGTP